MTTRMTDRAGRWRAAMATALACALLVGACSSGSDGADEDEPTTTTTTEGTSTPESTTTTEVTATTVVTDGDPTDFEIIVPDPDPSPLPVDDEVVIGQLDNGLTYYIRENDSPGGRLEFRMAVNAGSLQQDDPESGLAHFLEHMLFNGTERFPGNELEKALQDLGLAIGPDVNAYTSFDETVYSLSVATSNTGDITTAFDVLVDWSRAATLDEQDVIEERGVVREERRTRTETAEGRQFEVFLDAYTAGSDYFGASPIGSTEGILATTAEDTRRFYDRWYRPDLMAIVVVGDFSPARIERIIVDQFGDLEPRADTPDRTSPSAPPVDDRWVEVLIDPETSARRVSLDYWIPTWDVGTVGGERLAYLEEVIGAVIDNRLNDEVDRGNLRAISPFAGPFDLARHIRFLGFNFGGDDLAEATEDVIGELRRMELLGFTDDEVARVVTDFRSGLDQFLDGVGTTQDHEYADDYVAHYLGGGNIDAAESTYRRLNAVLDDVDAETLTNHFRYLMSVSAPLLAALGQDASDMPTVEELDAAVDRGLAIDVSDGNVVTEVAVTELMTPPDPVEATSRDELRDLNAFRMEFDNGVTAMFVESDISEGAVDLLAVGDGGWSTLSAADAELASLATGAAGLSGLGDLDPVQLGAFLDGFVVSLNPFIDEVDEGFVGSSSSDDIELLFQLLHLYVTGARVDDAAFRASVESIETNVRAAAADPQSASIVELFASRYGDGPRIVPDAGAIESATVDDALRIFRQRLGEVDDLVVTVAGDVEPDVVADLFEQYLGTLPAGAPDEHVDLWPEPPAEIVERSVSAGSDSAGAGVDFLFSGVTDVDERSMLAAEVISNIVRSRLFDTVREDLGASYGASVFVSPETRPDDVIETFILASGDPERLPLITETILEAVHSLATDGPSQEEFDRAVGILLTDYELVGNFQLMTMMLDAARAGSLDPFTRREASQVIADLTIGEIRELAAVMFPTDRWVQVTRS